MRIKLFSYRVAAWLYSRRKKLIYEKMISDSLIKQLSNKLQATCERLSKLKEQNLNSRMKRRNRAYRKLKPWYYYGKH